MHSSHFQCYESSKTLTKNESQHKDKYFPVNYNYRYQLYLFVFKYLLIWHNSELSIIISYIQPQITSRNLWYNRQTYHSHMIFTKGMSTVNVCVHLERIMPGWPFTSDWWHLINHIFMIYRTQLCHFVSHPYVLNR